MKRNRQTPSGFALIEVALALGVAAFALVAILGLLPIGLRSNQASIEQTAAATLAANVVADLRATRIEIPPVAKSSPRFQIPLPPTGSAMHTIFLREDGSAAGAVDADANLAEDPRYRVTLFITAPATVKQKAATLVRVLVTWPVPADRLALAPPSKFAGSYEVVSGLNRH